MTSHVVFEKICIDEELTGPVGIPVGQLASRYCKSTFDSFDDVGMTGVLDRPPKVGVGTVRRIAVGWSVCHLVQQKPTTRHLRCTGQTVPCGGTVPIPVKTTCQKTIWPQRRK